MTNRSRDGWLETDEVKGFEGFTIRVQAQVVGGQVRATRLHIDPVDPAEPKGLTAQRLASLPLQELARVAVSIGDFRLNPRLQSDLARIAGRPASEPHDPRAVTTPEQVAEVWLSAYHRGKAPRAAVVEHLGISERTAQNYINTAREQGLIPADKRGTSKREEDK